MKDSHLINEEIHSIYYRCYGHPDGPQFQDLQMQIYADYCGIGFNEIEKVAAYY